jgi:hypothetical protein
MTDGFLSDEELIRLLEQKTPEELTLQELDYLKQRLADSAPLREALLGQLQMESYLPWLRHRAGCAARRHPRARSDRRCPL